MKLRYNILFGVVYTVGFVLLALFEINGGNFNSFGILLILILTWTFNFVALFLLTQLETASSRIFFVIMMVVYYHINFLLFTEAARDDGILNQLLILLKPMLWFVLGQIFIWAIFFKQIRNKTINN
jgi:hypothetical protein